MGLAFAQSAPSVDDVEMVKDINVHVHANADVDFMRTRLKRFIWGTTAVPSEKLRTL
jgi:hypothetical protein